MLGVPFFNGRNTNEVPLLKKWYIMGDGLYIGEEPRRIKPSCQKSGLNCV